MFDCQDTRRYCHWRQRWLSGLPSQATAMVCHNGLARALALTIRLPAPEAARAPAASVAPALVLLTQAASMSCHLIHTLRVAHVQTLIP